MRFLILLGLVIVLTSALGEERELGGLEENQLVDADRRMTSEYIYELLVMIERITSKMRES